MPLIKMLTKIKAPIETVFDLARNVDLHLLSTKQTEEEVLYGKTSGLLDLNDVITWKAVHLGVRQTLTSKMVDLDRPYTFSDEMLKGAFKYMRHEHYFMKFKEGTAMVDVLSFSSPLGVAGKLFDRLYLRNYMICFIKRRNVMLKRVAESKEVRNFL